MNTITIEQAFGAAARFSEKQHGRGLQAKISRDTGVDSSNVNSIIKNDKGASEEVRRRIFESIIANVSDLQAKSYDQFLDFGRWIAEGNAPSKWSIGSINVSGSPSFSMTGDGAISNQQTGGAGNSIHQDGMGITIESAQEKPLPPPGVNSDDFSELMHWLKKHPSMAKALVEKARQVGSIFDDAINNG